MPTQLRNEKTYPFQSFEGREPTAEELRAELEEVYKYLSTQAEELAVDLTAALDRHDEVLCLGGEPVFLNGDIVMLVGIPNNNESIWPQQLN